tara:strand:+ start:345 stop:686 length:342 start_codon:yes stop_codon:yes gene_type:complete
MKILNFNNVKFILGQNAQENWDILDEAKKENEYYIWFHLNNFPSGYVIMYSTLSDISNNVNEYLLFGSNLCKNNTKYRNIDNIKICYTYLYKLNKTKNIGEIIVKGKKKIIKI